MPTLGKRGDKLDLLIRQGATLGPYKVRIADAVGVPQNLIGTIPRASIRKSYDDATVYPVTAVLTVPEDGQFSMTMTPAETAAIPYLGDLYEEKNEYVWDLELEYPDGKVVPIFWGIVRIAPEATR